METQGVEWGSRRIYSVLITNWKIHQFNLRFFANIH